MTSELLTFRARECRVEKYHGDVADPVHPGRAPYSIVTAPGNVLTKRGAYALWQRVTAGGGTTAGWAGHLGESDATPWRGAYIAVGDVGTAATASDTDLGAAGTANAFYLHMLNGYPQFEDGDAMNGALASVTDPANVVFRASFGTAVANFAWREWGLVAVGTNATENGAAGTTITATDTGGTFDNLLINHKIYEFGTKESGDTWIVNATFEIG